MSRIRGSGSGKRQLRQEGYEAEDVRNGVEAVMALRAQIANLILLDSEVPLGRLRTDRISGCTTNTTQSR